MDGVLLTEDADEHIKGFIPVGTMKILPLNIYPFNVVIYETDNGPYVDFVPVMRSFTKKKDKRYSNAKATLEMTMTILESPKQKMNDHPGKFTHQTNWYVSKNNIKGLGINAGIHCRKSGYFIVDLYLNKK